MNTGCDQHSVKLSIAFCRRCICLMPLWLRHWSLMLLLWRLVSERCWCAGLRIQRMPSEENQEFGNPARYDYMTVASPSCHDTSTTRAWWEEDAERRERFFYLVGPLALTPCPTDVQMQSRHMNSNFSCACEKVKSRSYCGYRSFHLPRLLH